MKNLTKLKIIFASPLLGLCSLFFQGCELGSNGGSINSLSFAKQVDSLAKYDSVVIVVKTKEGVVLDTIYNKKVHVRSDIEHLPVTNWDGGKILIDITGFNGGAMVYAVEKKFDGNTNTTDTTFVLFIPASILSTPDKNLKMKVGDSIPYPTITITPDNLNNKNLLWLSSQSDVVQISGSHIKALKLGSALVTVKLVADPNILLNIQVAVSETLTVTPVLPHDSILVIPKVVDTTAPPAPVVTGSPATSSNPKWTWSSSLGGSGYFRLKLGSDPTATEPETKATTFTFTSPVSPNTYILYVQERDSIGNWSSSGKFAIKFDLTKPSVTISAPLTSGNYVTMDSTVAISGTASGQNTITKVFYSVSNKMIGDAALEGSGAWSTASIVLIEGAPVPVLITVIDNLGNTSTASLTIQRDATGPTAPNALTQPTTPTNLTTASWSWAAGNGDGVNGSGLSGQYRYNLNNGNWVVTTTTTAIGLTLTEGVNTFAVQEQDKAGNWSASVSNTVTLDTKSPDAVTFVGTDKSYTTNRMPTWTWISSTINPGVGAYNLTLSGPGGNTAWDLNAKTWTSDKSLDDGVYTLTVKEKSSIPGIFGTSNTFTINVDGTAPLIQVNTYANSSAAPVTLSSQNVITISGSISDNVGGSGISYATYELSGGTTKSATAISNLSAFSFSTPAMTNHKTTTVTIRTKDKAGNAEQIYTIAFTIEVSPPKLIILQSPDSGFVTSAPSVTLSYSVNGVQKTEVVTFVEPSGPDQFTTYTKVFTATNAIGETVSETRTFYRVHSSVRFFDTGFGTGSCLSWTDACRLSQAMLDGKENLNLWIKEGTYNLESIKFPSGLSISGRLNSTSKSVTERFGNTYFTGSSLDITGITMSYINVTYNTGHLGYIISPQNAAEPATIIDHCIFENITTPAYGDGVAIIHAGVTYGVKFQSNVYITDSQFINLLGSSESSSIMKSNDGAMTITRCSFSGTKPTYDIGGYGLLTGIKIIDCTPLTPKTPWKLICVGLTCTPN